MYLRRFRLSLQETKAYFDCVNCSGRNKMSYELARLTQDDVRVISSRDFLQFPIFGSTLPQFVLYCAIGQFRRPSCTFPRLAGHHEYTPHGLPLSRFPFNKPRNEQCFDLNGSFPVSRCCCVLSGLCLLIIPFIFLYLFKTFENNPKIPKHLLYQ